MLPPCVHSVLFLSTHLLVCMNALLLYYPPPDPLAPLVTTGTVQADLAFSHPPSHKSALSWLTGGQRAGCALTLHSLLLCGLPIPG